MRNNKKAQAPKIDQKAGTVKYTPFPRPVCLEHCTMNTPKGYENDIFMTLKSFSNKDAYNRKNPHKLEGREDIISLDVKSRNDKYRLLFYIEKETGICKITNLCTSETHK